ncbi:hypothetical protein [Salmonella enterica]|nr:hypothetical protein [Salmonella enterica]EDA5911896.1 hypothetical protein [Salmonella enterica subsp. enterica serovar Cerro]EHI7371346.1 hypothetical protein [Salmonella enterica]ELY6968843.1 hypothetical protein [Salmonella enterica]
MDSWAGVIIMGLVMNISSIVPALFLKIEKKVKISILIRIYLLSVFLILTLITFTTNIIGEYLTFPVWLPIASVVFFMISLTAYIKYIRQYISKWKRRSIVLLSFFIVYAIRFNALFINTGVGYEITSFGVVWTSIFLFACLLAYIGTSDTKHLDAAYYSLTTRTSEPRRDKSYAPQTEIDYDVAIKGRSVLNNPNLSLVEQQRYRDALQKKEDDLGSNW